MKKIKEKVKRSRGEWILHICVTVFLSILAATILGAFFITIINTFKDPWDYALGNTYKFPAKKYGGWHFENYGQVFEVLEVADTGYFGMVFNSLWQTAFQVFVPMAATVMASYAYARYAFPGRKAIYFIAIILLTLSFPGSLPATYKLYADLGLRNTPLFYIGATAGLGTNFIVLVSSSTNTIASISCAPVAFLARLASVASQPLPSSPYVFVSSRSFVT